MNNSMKTAVSISDQLFDDVARAAREENVSRSKIFTEAIRDYLDRRKSGRLLAALNEAYSDQEPAADKKLRKRARKYYARRILRERW